MIGSGDEIRTLNNMNIQYWVIRFRFTYHEKAIGQLHRMD